MNPTVTIKVPNLVTQQPDQLPVRARQASRCPGALAEPPSREVLDQVLDRVRREL